MKTKKIILITLGCLVATTVFNSCKTKIVEPNTDQKKDTTNIAISRTPKKIISYGQSSTYEECSTCRQEQALTFDTKGHLTKIVHTFYDGSTVTKQEENTYEWGNDKLVKYIRKGIIPLKHEEITNYRYNAQGKLIEIKGGLEFPYTSKYYYSPEGRLVNIIRDHDSTFVVETDSSLTEFTYRINTWDGLWVPSVTYKHTKRGNTFTTHEISYATPADKIVVVSSESTITYTMSDIPFSKQLQIGSNMPDLHKLHIFDFAPASSYRILKENGETTTEQCTFQTTQDRFKRIIELKSKCDNESFTVEY